MNFLKKKKLYFISKTTYSEALAVAQALGLRASQWVFVPGERKLRYSAIAGRHGIPRGNIIGDFSDEEIIYLTMKVPPPEDDKDATTEATPARIIAVAGDSGAYLPEPEKKEEEEEED